MSFIDMNYLYAIPAIVLFIGLFYLICSRSNRARIHIFTSPTLLNRLLRNHSTTRKRIKLFIFMTSIGLLLFCLARPQWGFEFKESKGKGIDFVIALDTSKSMLAQDIRPNRLIRSKLAILDLIAKLRGDRVGLVAFSGSAFLQCPLTLDYDAFTQSLNALDTDIINRGGTDIALAIAEAKAAFAKDSENKIIVLITDGEDLEASGIMEAKAAKEEGIRIYTVGVGSEEGELIPVAAINGEIEYLKDGSGNLVRTKLDAETLQIISSFSGAFYVSLFEEGGLDSIYEEGLALVPEEERKIRMDEVAIDRYQAFAIAAFLLLILEPLIHTRKRNHKP